MIASRGTAIALAVVLVLAACGEDTPSAVTTTVPPTTAPPDCGGLQPAPDPSPGATAPRPSPSVALTDLGVTLAEPTAIVAAPGSDDLLVAERSGTIRRLVAVGDAFEPAAEVILDLSDQVGPAQGELGLLGLAVSPAGDRLYVDRTQAQTGELVVESIDLVDGAPVEASRTELLRIESPCGAHYGGGLVVDRDGDLLIGIGNGGGVADPADRGRDPHDLFGSILRITPTPDGPAPYEIPAANPFADGADGAPEVLVLGLRNPWRFDLDGDSGDLWIADVGEDEVEEVTRVVPDRLAGANLGWDFREGTQPFEDAEAAPEDLVDPQVEYHHDDGGCSVTGGVVVAPGTLPGLDGAFLFGDLCTGILRAARPGPGEAVEVEDLGVTLPGVVTFGRDRAGRTYVASLGGGVARVDPLP